MGPTYSTDNSWLGNADVLNKWGVHKVRTKPRFQKALPINDWTRGNKLSAIWQNWRGGVNNSGHYCRMFFVNFVLQPFKLWLLSHRYTCMYSPQEYICINNQYTFAYINGIPKVWSTSFVPTINSVQQCGSDHVSQHNISFAHICDSD